MKDRVKKIRKELDLTQQEFADKIGVKRNTIAMYEMGKTTPSETVILSICREFGINEEWLRTGSGDMFVKRTRNQIITDFAGDLICEQDTFKTRLIEGLAKLNPEDWEQIKRIVVKLTKKED